MNEALTFLPWLRRGLGQALTASGPLSGPIARGPAVTAWVDVLESRASRDVRLHGPDHVVGLAPGQVLRTEPRADSTEVETTIFPYVELAAPDLPWLYTPAAPGAQGLRPWLVLVVVREQEGVWLETPPTGLPLLHIDTPAVIADELPDLADAWAWAHVQSLVGAAGAAAAVTAATGEVIARLVCPRRLLPDRAWLACVVPAFDGGVVGGRGETVPNGATWQPAWDHRAARWPGPLPTYHSWRFSTGQGGDFETLCRRLAADDSGVDFGLQAMDVGDPGLIDPAPERILVDYQGALRTPGVVPRPWGRDRKALFQPAVTDLLNGAAVRVDVQPPAPGAPYDPRTQDPVVGPPLYGQWPAGVHSVPGAGWVPELNLDPATRAAAGLGARAVQAAQEELVAAAWDQAGSLRATVTALNQGRLAVEAGRRLTTRVKTLGDGDVLHLTAPLQALLGSVTESIRSRLAAGAVPAGLVSTAHLRLTRPGTPLARDWARLAGSARRLGAQHVETTVGATRQASSPALTFAMYGRLEGAQVRDPVIFDADAPDLTPAVRPSRPPPPPLAAARRAAREAPLEDLPGPQEPGTFPAPGAEDVSEVAADVLAGLDPLAAVRGNLLARIPALDGLLPADTLPTTLGLTPTFADGLSDDLTRLAPEFLLPGAGELGHNRVRLVESDPEFVATFLVGANHELARELLWRGYPVDLTGTFFQRFWRYLDSGTVDIEPLADWTRTRSIAANLPQGKEAITVFVVRGDVVRRYPTAHYFLQQARLDGDGAIQPVAGEVLSAAVRGALDRDTLFVGFEKPTSEVIGDRPGGGDPGWLLAIEEQPAAARFGLDDPPEPPDEPEYGAPPAVWNDLSWDNVARSEAQLARLTHAPVDVDWLTRAPIEDTTWGANAAHMARATYQQPFRIYFPADQLD